MSLGVAGLGSEYWLGLGRGQARSWQLESEGEEWDSDEEVDLEKVEAEMEDLQHKMVEAGDLGLPKKKKPVPQKTPVINNSGEGFNRE